MNKHGKNRQARDRVIMEFVTTKRKERSSTRTLQKSTPSLLSRMRINPSPERLPNLLDQLSQSSKEQTEKEFERKSRNSWIKYPEKNSKMKKLSNKSLERERKKKTCLGISHLPVHLEGEAALKPAKPSSNSVRTCQESKPSFELLATSPKESLHHSGTGSFEENQLTSTKSSRQCTLSNLMKRERDMWEELRLFLPWQNPSDRSKQEENGRQRSDGWRRQWYSYSPIGRRNYPNMPSTSKASSQ